MEKLLVLVLHEVDLWNRIFRPERCRGFWRKTKRITWNKLDVILGLAHKSFIYSTSGIGKILDCEGRMNSGKYINVLETTFMPPLTRIFDNNNLNEIKFQQCS